MSKSKCLPGKIPAKCAVDLPIWRSIGDGASGGGSEQTDRR